MKGLDRRRRSRSRQESGAVDNKGSRLLDGELFLRGYIQKYVRMGWKIGYVACREEVNCSYLGGLNSYVERFEFLRRK